ncbi:Alpha-1D adrenergic receptor [Chelonia mydas]|uniref:Alpha-1D adrenergic receptor n=1 Tax=Chelonia mydas TaxID=8469 RepID=M7B9N2_CHEMY|nr:Alpha-1D adrenergic receptor [Chelonia mydas]
MTFPDLINASLNGNRTGQGSANRSWREWGLPGEEAETNGTSLPLALDLQAVGVGVFLALFILSAIVGNILVILSVACNRHLQTVTNYFIVNLAIADLLLSTTVLPFSATLEVLGSWAFGRIFCDIWAAVDVLCCSASIMSLCIISVDRYIGVKYSLKYPAIMTEKKALVILGVVWLSSMVISIGPLLGWKEPPPPDESICSITEEPGYALFSSLFSFYLPLMVILVMYFRVYVVARRTTKSLEAGVKKERGKSMEVVLRIHCRSVVEDSLSSSRSKGHNFRSSLSVRLLKFSREKKAAKTLAIVVGVFILCWFPFFFVLPFGRNNNDTLQRTSQDLRALVRTAVECPSAAGSEIDLRLWFCALGLGCPGVTPTDPLAGGIKPGTSEAKCMSRYWTHLRYLCRVADRMCHTRLIHLVSYPASRTVQAPKYQGKADALTECTQTICPMVCMEETAACSFRTDTLKIDGHPAIVDGTLIKKDPSFSASKQ